jgi:UDP-N-acetylmuramyl pentapeptide synthase
VAVGALAGEAARAFGDEAETCADIEAATAVLSALLGPEVTVLVKASRSMGLERLVAALAAPAGDAPC